MDEEFIADLVGEAEADIRGCLDQGAVKVQIDFTEGRLAVKLAPSRGLLRQLIDLNNQVLRRFTPEEQQRIGIHTCPGGDQDSTHSADVDSTARDTAFAKIRARVEGTEMASRQLGL